MGAEYGTECRCSHGASDNVAPAGRIGGLYANVGKYLRQFGVIVHIPRTFYPPMHMFRLVFDYSEWGDSTLHVRMVGDAECLGGKSNQFDMYIDENVDSRR